MSDDLKPCPFCTEGKSVSTYFDHEQGDKWGYAACDACGSRGPEVRTGYDRADDALWRAEAITSWNTRTPDTSIEALTVEREFFEEEWVSAVDKLNKAVEALDDLLEAITAEDRFGDRSLTITGPTANLKWLLETEEEARATLAEIEGEQT
jgi:Lar family restriction alleviation protein